MTLTLYTDNPDNEWIVVRENEAGERLDKILASRYPGIHSRTYFQYLIEQEKVYVNGEVVKKRYQPSIGDEIQIHYILTPEIGLNPEAIPLDVIFEDSDLIVINKPPGMVVHPAPGHSSGTFVHALLHHCKNLPPDISKNSYPRPGIVHRLDKDTSGLLVAAKTTLTHKRLIEMFASREIYKEYLAICVGNPGHQEITTLIGRHPVHRQKMKVLDEGGREAVSVCDTLSSQGSLSLVRIHLKTGRTHQIRVHMQHVHAPVLGDPVYGNTSVNKKHAVSRQLLHAHILRFKHPITHQSLELKAPLPSDMEVWVEKLQKKNI
ncbi:MAG: 23S rRNA pseudouridylate synthase [Chlamydiales bacterium 38-26]|nr:RluA family pseudouridine synthase [Chlamydiales bacterium]OJV10968.1 MAG: 23S rRNA pseudouridylate synthase [Chlamydiales bacterium 38-26]